MPITPVIQDRTYIINSDPLNTLLNAINDAYELSQDSSIISSSRWSEGWARAYEIGKTAKTTQTTINANANQAPSNAVAVDAISTSLTPIVSAFDYLSSQPTSAEANNLVSAIHSFRAPNNFHETQQNILNSEAPNRQLLTRPSIQEFLTNVYTSTAETILQGSFSTLQSELESNKQILTATKVLSKVLGLKLEVDASFGIIQTTKNLDKASAWFTDNHPDVKTAYTNLKTIADDESTNTDIKNAINKVLDTKLKNYADNGSGTAWFEDAQSTTNVNSLTTSVSYINNKLMQQINESFLLYSKFYQSAIATLSTVDNTLSTAAKKVSGK